MKYRKEFYEGIAVAIATVGAVLVVVALFPFLNPTQAMLEMRNSTGDGHRQIIAIALMIIVGVILMVTGLKMSKKSKEMN